MERVQTKIYRDPNDADQRLSELRLTRKGLLRVAAIAVHEAANATPFHCKNAAGTFAYHHGTWALRHVFAGSEWEPAYLDGVEVIRNKELKIRVAYSNVDIACDDLQEPKPRSKKGAGSERVCIGNRMKSLFENLPSFAPRPSNGEGTYYLMVDEHGATELTMPVISLGTFDAYVERIYLSDGSDLATDILPLDDGDIADYFDPQIARR